MLLTKNCIVHVHVLLSDCQQSHLLIHYFLRQFLAVQKSDPNPANEKVKRMGLSNSCLSV